MSHSDHAQPTKPGTTSTCDASTEGLHESAFNLRDLVRDCATSTVADPGVLRDLWREAKRIHEASGDAP